MPGDADTAGGAAIDVGAAPPLGRGFGHGKVILVGEHAVVHGHAALAAGISTGIAVEARAGRTPGESRLSVPAWNLVASAGDGTPVGRALEAIVRRIEAPGLDFVADARIPARAGLGSSAALSVAIARAAAAAVGRADATDAIDAAVMAAEEVFHGSPSGIDAAAAKSGVTGRFTRAAGWQPVPVLQKITICVGLSGRPRDTAAQVAAVGRLRARLPVADELLALLGRLADDAGAALAKGDVDGLGRIMDVSHGLLAALRLSSPELETLVHGARAAGAVGAKLTGAGGGGAVIALAPGHARDVLARWRAAGYEGFLADIVAAPASGLAAAIGGTPR
jgi:mevalonate kinase